MKFIKRLFCIIAIIISVEIALIACVATGIMKPLNYKSTQNTNSATETTNTNIYSNNQETDENSSYIETEPLSENEKEVKNNVEEEIKEIVKESISAESKNIEPKTPLNIKLKDQYLDAYSKATKNLLNSESDVEKKLVVKIGLQILQSKTIKYENQLHFYSLSYAANGGTAKAKYYSLKNCISRINSGKTIYTDCFGFVRLTHSIAAYALSQNAPETVDGLSGLYGYKGSYTGSKISSLEKLTTGTVIYDRLTGTGSSTNRHVAMFLYSDGKTVTYMDQGGIYTGEYKYNSYIYHAKSTPYKFNTYKSYC